MCSFDNDYFYSTVITVIYSHFAMNVNEFAADDADRAPANGAADDNEDDDSGSVASVVNAADEMDLALGYIGFDSIIVRDWLRNEGLQDFSDLKSMKEKDIWDIAESFNSAVTVDSYLAFGVPDC